MKLSTLNNKLRKLNVTTATKDINGYNMVLVFTLNGKTYEADYTKGQNEVLGFTFDNGYNEAIQETTRRFFDTFPQVLRHSQN